MISNIFGLHLGCKCKSDTDEFTLFGMRPSPFECEDTVYLQGEYNDLYDIKDCKLLLKPLSAMSDEDKREFENVMMCNFKFEKIYLYDINKGHPNHKKQWIVLVKTTIGTELYVNGPDQIIWLCSKGYDVGIVPDEYKEIYHGK